MIQTDIFQIRMSNARRSNDFKTCAFQIFKTLFNLERNMLDVEHPGSKYNNYVTYYV